MSSYSSENSSFSNSRLNLFSPPSGYVCREEDKDLNRNYPLTGTEDTEKLDWHFSGHHFKSNKKREEEEETS